MKRSLIFTIALAATFMAAGCDELPRQAEVRTTQAMRARNAANEIDFSSGNAEIENIRRRAEFVAQPDLVGYVVLISFGRPVAYYTVKGKITSSGKRLESPSRVDTSGINSDVVVPTPSYDGTFGNSDEYIYFWTTNGQYVQWSTGGGNGYIYSDQPLQPNGNAAAAVLNTPEAAH